MDNGPTFTMPITTTHQTGDVIFPSNHLPKGRYRLEESIDEGGQGVLWKATDLDLNRLVALKFILDSKQQGKEEIANLRDEALKLARLKHPNIVTVYEFAQDNLGNAAVVMGYVQGKNLSELKVEQPGGCFDWEQIEPWILQLCDALHEAHTTQPKTIHRDLKPKNLLIDKRGNLQVVDFGLSRTIFETTENAKTIGREGQTPGYAGPQQLDGKAPAVSDDIYGLGATIYDLLTGTRPFRHGDASAIKRATREDDPMSMAATRRELLAGKVEEKARELKAKAVIPQRIESLVSKMLEKSVEQRQKSIVEVSKAIAGKKKSQKIKLVAIALLTTGGVGAVAFWGASHLRFNKEGKRQQKNSEADSKERQNIAEQKEQDNEASRPDEIISSTGYKLHYVDEINAFVGETEVPIYVAEKVYGGNWRKKIQSYWEKDWEGKPPFNLFDYGAKESYPMCYVSLLDAEKLAEKLTKLDRKKGVLPEGYIYRLPTRMEYAHLQGLHKIDDYGDIVFDTEFPWGNKLDLESTSFSFNILGNESIKTTEHTIDHQSGKVLGGAAGAALGNTEDDLPSNVGREDDHKGLAPVDYGIASRHGLKGILGNVSEMLTHSVMPESFGCHLNAEFIGTSFLSDIGDREHRFKQYWTGDIRVDRRVSTVGLRLIATKERVLSRSNIKLTPLYFRKPVDIYHWQQPSLYQYKLENITDDHSRLNRYRSWCSSDETQNSSLRDINLYHSEGEELDNMGLNSDPAALGVDFDRRKYLTWDKEEYQDDITFTEISEGANRFIPANHILRKIEIQNIKDIRSGEEMPNLHGNYIEKGEVENFLIGTRHGNLYGCYHLTDLATSHYDKEATYILLDYTPDGYYLVGSKHRGMGYYHIFSDGDLTGGDASELRYLGSRMLPYGFVSAKFMVTNLTAKSNTALVHYGGVQVCTEDLPTFSVLVESKSYKDKDGNTYSDGGASFHYDLELFSEHGRTCYRNRDFYEIYNSTGGYLDYKPVEYDPETRCIVTLKKKGSEPEYHYLEVTKKTQQAIEVLLNLENTIEQIRDSPRSGITNIEGPPSFLKLSSIDSPRLYEIIGDRSADWDRYFALECYNAAVHSDRFYQSATTKAITQSKKIYEEDREGNKLRASYFSVKSEGDFLRYLDDMRYLNTGWEEYYTFLFHTYESSGLPPLTKDKNYELLRTASQAGSAISSLILAKDYLLENPKYVETKDQEEAFWHLMKCLDSIRFDSIEGKEIKDNIYFMLAEMFEEGRGVTKSEKQALRYYEIAYKKDYSFKLTSEELEKIGAIYEKGLLDADDNSDKARMIFDLAKERKLSEVSKKKENEAIADKIPVATPVPDKDGYVYNPFTKGEVDVRGIPSGTKLRDPADSNPQHVFKLP